MESRIFIGYALLGAVACSIAFWVLLLAAKRWRARRRRKKVWSSYYR